MRIFALNRISYFDELGDDPEIDAYLSKSAYLNDWVPGVIDGKWNPQVKSMSGPPEARRPRKYVSIFNNEMMVIHFEQVKFDIKSTSHVVFYYDIKHDCILFIRTDTAKDIVANKKLIEKIQILISTILDKKQVGMGTISIDIKDIDNGIALETFSSFKANRLAYFDELGNDPEIDKAIRSSDISNRFIGEIDNEDRLWIPEMIERIPELQISKDHSFIVSSREKLPIAWARVEGPEGVSYMGGASSLCTERSRRDKAFWDTKTKRILFIHNQFADKFNDEAFREKFFKALAETLDSAGHVIRL